MEIENKLVIEVYGDYFHANPKFYKPDDEIRRYKGFEKAKQIWKDDNERQQIIESFGYRVVVIWEHDIINGETTKILNYVLGR